MDSNEYKNILQIVDDNENIYLIILYLLTSIHSY